MHFILALLSAAAASTALALPHNTPTPPTKEFPPADPNAITHSSTTSTQDFPPGPYKAASCTSTLFQPPGSTCKVRGAAKTPGKEFTVVDLLENVNYGQCQAACLRNFNCYSTWTNGKYCYLWAQTLFSGGFVEDDTSDGFWTDRYCSGFKGQCNLENGDFEVASSGGSQSRSWYFGHYQYGAAYAVHSDDVNFPPAPSGKSILSMGGAGTELIYAYQDLLIVPGKKYNLSYYYNFHQFHKGSKRHATKYRLYISLCDFTVAGLFRNVTDFDDKWYKETTTFTAPTTKYCTNPSAMSFMLGFYAYDPPRDAPTDELFSTSAIVGIDKISMTPSA